MYRKLDAYVKEYYQFIKIESGNDLKDDQMRQQVEIVNEMLSLLPPKLDKMVAAMRLKQR